MQLVILIFMMVVGIRLDLIANIDMPSESFLFVRHGKTNWSNSMIKYGPLNLPLNERGVKDAKKAALLLKNIENCVVISSDLARAEQTARIIARTINQASYVFPGLHERYFGDFRLLKGESIENVVLSDAETDEYFEARVYKALSDLLRIDYFRGKQKIIVSHSLVFKCLSFLLAGEKVEIDFGEIYLFISPKDNEKWKLQKIDTQYEENIF